MTIVERKSAIPEANWYGGKSLGNGACTTGLSLRNSAGTLKFTSSAGHCSFSIYPQHNLTVYASFDSGPYDLTVLTTSNSDTVKNWVADNDGSAPTPYYREINSYTINASVNSYVCKYGATTFYTCGTIEQNNYTYRGYSTWYLIKSASTTQKISCPGDSGAAWYSGSYAYGNHTAGWCDLSSTYNKAVVMPIQQMINQGYYPMTQP